MEDQLKKGVDASPVSKMPVNRVYLFSFFLSGAAGLVYQIVWIRILSIVFGNTTYAVSMVVAAFLTGLAVGSHYWGKRADKVKRPLDTYIKLELLIGLSALATTALIYIFDDALVNAMTVESISSPGWQLLRYLIVFILLFAPTLFMGGTAPLMAKIFVKSRSALGSGIGSVYAANTYGGMAGCFISGFLMVPLLGVKGSILTAFLLNITVALMLWLTRNAAKTDRGDEPKSAVTDNPVEDAAISSNPGGFSVSPVLALSLFAVSGFSALAFEILWTRAFIVSFKSTVYMFSNLLTVFLFGMALGSHIASKRLDSVKDPLKLFGIAQVGIGLLGILSVLFFYFFPEIFNKVGMALGGMDWGTEIIIMLLFMLAVFLIPTALMGLSYPLVCRVTTHSVEKLGKNVGWVYAVGTAGGILGSLLAGFFILPLIGLQNGIFIVAVIALINGQVALLSAGTNKSALLPMSLSAVFAVIIFSAVQLTVTDIGIGTTYGGKLLFAREGLLGTVKVVQQSENAPLRLMVNDYSLAGTNDVSVRFGHIPLLLKPGAEDVLLISLGSGITAGSVGAHPVKNIECVEIVPTLLDVQHFFASQNHKITENKRFKLTFWDGRHYVRVTKRKYDLIIADLFQPDGAGVGNLYALEHFLEVKRKLKKGGAMAQWLPMYQFSPDNLKIVMRTFAQSFDHVTVWLSFIKNRRPSLLLLGSPDPIEIDPEKIASVLKQKGVKEDMIEHADLASFLSSFVMDREGLLQFTGASPINTDDNPIIEYSAPRNLWNRDQFGPLNYFSLIDNRQSVSRLIPPAKRNSALNEELKRYYDARTNIMTAMTAGTDGDYNKELNYLREASALAPGDPILSFTIFDQGRTYYSEGNYRMSTELFKWVRKRNPEWEKAALYYLANSYDKMGMKTKSRDALRELELLRMPNQTR